MGILIETLSTIKKGIDKGGKKKKKPPVREVGSKGGTLGSGAAQKAHDAIKGSRAKTKKAIMDSRGKKEQKGRR